MPNKFKQSIYKLRNPKKYIGNPDNICCRSSWERKFCIFADTSPSVLKWNSEEVIIQYISQIDGRIHKYFIDFYMEYQLHDGTIEKYLIEVKPDSQTRPPIKGRNQKTYLYAIEQYAKNISKWKAAKKFAEERNLKFRVLTEKHLGMTSKTF